MSGGVKTKVALSHASQVTPFPDNLKNNDSRKR